VVSSALRVAGDDNPLSDLLFSPHAAFIWNNRRRAFIWMNRAAREKFKLDVHELSAALPDETAKQLVRFPNSRRSSGAQLQITVAGAFQCLFSLSPFKLAGDDEGIILAEMPPDGSAGFPMPAVKSLKRSKPDLQKKPKTAKRVASMHTAQTLTPEEWRSFKAIGRKVRKLCREKLQAGAAQDKVSAPLIPLRQQSPSEAAPPDCVRAIAATFDVFLTLDAGFRVLKVEGRPRRLGWRKSGFQGRAVRDLIPASEKGIFDRIVRKVAGHAAQVSRDALLVQNAEGVSWPCRVVFGQWPFGRGAFFLALTSLDMPARLKRLELQSGAAIQSARLAA
jgi:hypothetical protein